MKTRILQNIVSINATNQSTPNQIQTQIQPQNQTKPYNQNQSVIIIVPEQSTNETIIPSSSNKTNNEANAQLLIDQNREKAKLADNQYTAPNQSTLNQIQTQSQPQNQTKPYNQNQNVIIIVPEQSTNETIIPSFSNKTNNEANAQLLIDQNREKAKLADNQYIPPITDPINSSSVSTNNNVSIAGKTPPVEPFKKNDTTSCEVKPGLSRDFLQGIFSTNATANFCNVNQPINGAAQGSNTTWQKNVIVNLGNATELAPQPREIVGSNITNISFVVQNETSKTNVTKEVSSNVTQSPVGPLAPQNITVSNITNVTQSQVGPFAPQNITVSNITNVTQSQVGPLRPQNITVFNTTNVTQSQVGPLRPQNITVFNTTNVTQSQVGPLRPKNITVSNPSNDTQSQIGPLAPQNITVSIPGNVTQSQVSPSAPQNITVSNPSNVTQSQDVPLAPQNITVSNPGNVTQSQVTPSAPQNITVSNTTNGKFTGASFLQKLTRRFSFLQVSQRVLQNITIPTNAPEVTVPLLVNQTRKIILFQNKSFLSLPVDFTGIDLDIKQSAQYLLNFLSERRTENVNLIYANLINPAFPKPQVDKSTSQNVTVITKNPRMLYISSQQLNNDTILNRKYYKIYDDLTNNINKSILITNNQVDFKNTYCVNSMDNIFYFIKQNFAENLMSRDKSSEIYFDKLMSLWFDTQSEINSNKCANDFLIVSQYDLLAGTDQNALFANSTNVNYTNVKNIPANFNNIVTYCVDCPNRYRKYNLNYPEKAISNNTGNFSANNLNIGEFNLQEDLNVIRGNNSAAAAENTNTRQNPNRKIGYFYLSFGCLNQKPFGFGTVKNAPYSPTNNNNMEMILSYTYNNISLDSRCMSRSIACLNKGTDNKNSTFCASDYLNPSCSRLTNLNGICLNEPFNYKTIRTLQQQTPSPNNPNQNNLTIIVMNATAVPISNTTITVISPQTSVNYNFKSVLDNLGATNLYNGNQPILFIPYFCDLKNYVAGKPLFKSYNPVFNTLISEIIKAIKQQTDRLNLQSNNQAIHDLIQNYNYDFMKLDMSDSSFYDLYLKKSYSSDKLNNIFEPVVNLNVARYLYFNNTTTKDEFEPRFLAYLFKVRDNATNVAKDNYIRNCFSWVHSNFLSNSISLNTLNFANYSNIVVISNLEMNKNAKNGRFRFMQQTQETSFKIMDNDPTATDAVLSNFQQNAQNAFTDNTNKVKNIVKIDGSTVDSPANYTDIQKNINSTQYFANLNYLNETEHFGSMNSSINDNLVAFYSSRNQTPSPDAVIIFIPKPQNQTVAKIGARYINTGFSIVFALIIFVLI